jgi:multidrug efflux pump subunit AcrA (membrane-fusion protein)
VRVRIAFEQLDPRILPDMGIKVRFLEERAEAGPATPKLTSKAVVRDEAGASVWVVRDGRVERRPVKLGEELDGHVPVLEGLQGGEAVVVDPPRRLRDGAAVELQAQ